MKIPFYIPATVSGLCLIFGVSAMVHGLSNQRLQAEVQRRQMELAVLDDKMEEKQQVMQAQEGTMAKRQEALRVQHGKIEQQRQANQGQEERIKTGNQIGQQIGPSLLRDMGASAVHNEKMKALLAKQGDELKAKLNSVVLDLLILAKTDDDAKTIIAKYSIKENPPAPNAPATVPK